MNLIISALFCTDALLFLLLQLTAHFLPKLIVISVNGLLLEQAKLFFNNNAALTYSNV